MTETQAKSGNAGAPAKPDDDATRSADKAPGVSPGAASGQGDSSADGGNAATGQAAVGRATVPGEAPAPKFTRAPGMAPPPDRPSDQSGEPSKETEKTVAAPSAGTTPAPARPTAGTSVPTRDTTQAGTGSTGSRFEGTRFGVAGGGLPQGVPSSGGSAPSAVGAARVTEAVRAARNSVGSAAGRGPRRARLNLKRIDPWSVMKFAFAVSLVLFFVIIVATSVLYLALDAMGVFESVNSTVADTLNNGSGGGFAITATGVIGTSALVGLINVVLFTALATLSAFVYNVCADLVGGVELTLAERD
ncbi:DUF3566 domain-containing protein [Melissospora conviva]|uniref:DUF3566 domain-containing protein n=1 Tax=Melissospora conviva TaxID=3388432 RepID=UPI003C1AB251